MKSKIQNPKSKINPKSKCQIVKHKFYHLLFVICALSFVICLTGCDAFVRKFTRKPKKEELPHEELVLAPEEYKGPQMTKEELYRQYFLFWKSWHDELINALTQGASQKKQIYCIEEAIKNLESLREFLNEQAQKKLDPHILDLKELKDRIGRDLYGNEVSNNAQKAEHIKRSILKDFSFSKISKDIS